MISVEFGVTVSMFAFVATPGTPKGLQFRGLNQPLEIVPVQLDWACAETVDAASSAMVATNPDERNLQAVRAPEHVACADSDTPNDNDKGASADAARSQDFRRFAP